MSRYLSFPPNRVTRNENSACLIIFSTKSIDQVYVTIERRRHPVIGTPAGACSRSELQSISRAEGTDEQKDDYVRHILWRTARREFKEETDANFNESAYQGVNEFTLNKTRFFVGYYTEDLPVGVTTNREILRTALLSVDKIDNAMVDGIETLIDIAGYSCRLRQPMHAALGSMADASTRRSRTDENDS